MNYDDQVHAITISFAQRLRVLIRYVLMWVIVAQWSHPRLSNPASINPNQIREGVSE
jgi:hypothetical protein